MHNTRSLIGRAALLALSLAAPAAVNAQVPPSKGPLETVVEATSDTVVLPSTPEGAANVRSCTQCPLLTLRATRTTRYFIETTPATLDELRKAMLGRSVYVEVAYMHPGATLTRITLYPQVQIK